MKSRVVVLITSLVVALAGTLIFSSGTQSANAFSDRDCGDFSTQAAAQNFYLNAGGPRSDPHRLDADGDGVVCESNPCPCSTSQGGGENTGGGKGNTAGGGKGNNGLRPRVVERAVITRVIDGDTVDVRIRKGGRARVRLVGIDTPEVFGGVECGGRAASRFAKKFLPRGTPVLLASDRTQDRKDRYDRLLRYVFKNGRVDVNNVQVKRGNARVYVYNHKPFELVKRYRAAQSSAKRKNRGLWRNCR